ncbi:MAG: aminotransferase class V-fold PLP-dependent enzyme, partial [bacterium]
MREQFPALRQTVYGKNLIYFDNGATSQKPQVVLEAINRYYSKDNANIHRGIHTLAEKATHAFEETRKSLQHFIHSPSAEQIIFTKGVTESINLVVQTWGRQFLQAGDEVVITTMEHHSNI